MVRSAISVNPETSALTVTADPLPTELDGIPLQLRLVNVTIDRPEFTFNPTNCDKLAIGGTLTSTQAASANESSPFQVTNCAALEVPAEVHGLDLGENLESERREPRREGVLSQPAAGLAGEHRQVQGRSSQAAAVAA